MGILRGNFRPSLAWAIAVAILVLLQTGPASAEFGFSGMQIQGMKPEIAKALGLEKPHGVLIRDVAVGGPADAAGIRRGDIIVKFAGKEIDTFKRLVQVVRGTKPGQSVKVTVLRKSGRKDLTLKLGQRPDAWKITKDAVVNIPKVGLTLAAISKKIRDRFALRWGSIGVLVTLIAPEVASTMQLERGDIIVQVNQEDVWKPSQVAALYKKAKTDGRKRLLILVERVSGFEYMLLPVK